MSDKPLYSPLLQVNSIVLGPDSHQSEEAFLLSQMVNRSPANQEALVQSLSKEDPLEKGRAARPSILAWVVLKTEEPGG